MNFETNRTSSWSHLEYPRHYDQVRVLFYHPGRCGTNYLDRWSLAALSPSPLNEGNSMMLIHLSWQETNPNRMIIMDGRQVVSIVYTTDGSRVVR